MKEKPESKYIRKIYLIPSVLVIAVFIVGSFVYSNVVRNALLGKLKINSMEIAEGFMKEIEYGIAAKKTIENLLEDKIRNTARIVFRNRGNLSNQLLYDLAEDLQVDEIHWFNRDGKLIYSTVEGYLGWQTHPRHPLYAILQGQEELMEDIRPDEKFGNLLKHGALRDTDGTFVQVAISAERVEELTEKFGFENLISQIGNKEQILYVALLNHAKEPLILVDKEKLSEKLQLNKVDIQENSFGERQALGFYEMLLPLQINDSFQGYLHLAYSKKNINAFLIRNLVVLNLLGIFMLTLSIYFARKFQERVIVNPIKDLKNDVEKISLEKSLEYRLPIKDEDPFYNLRNRINYLLNKIQGHVENLKKKQEDLELNNRELEETLGQLAASEEEIRAQYEELESLLEKNQELRQRYEIAIKSTGSFVWEVDRELKLNHSLIEGIMDFLNIDIGAETIEAEKVIRKVVYSEDAERLLEELEKMYKGQYDEVNTQVRILDKLGAVKWYLVKGRKIYDAGGKWKSINGVMIDITDLKQQEMYIQYMAEHDQLTGIYNRRKLFDVLEGELGKGKRGWILLLDLDNFKNINDILGHFYGDNLLKNIVDVLKEELSQGDFYRIGGDEFIILLKEDVDIKSYCSEILKILKDRVKVQKIEHPITASIGIVEYPQDGRTIEELFKKADIAMYQAKYSGKSKYMVFNLDMEERFAEKIKIETILRNALKENGFTLLYQPVVYASDGTTAYVEALLRLKEVNISPALFIPIAEESDLIIHIGKWVIEKVLRDIKNWQEKGLKTMVSINISPKQLYDGKFLTFLSEGIKDHGISPHALELEITENVLLENQQDNISLLNKIKEIGIKISLDDFGTGYSSINYLTYIPLDKIKLDKSVKDRFIELDKIQIIDSIVNIAHGLGLKVVAEGIEDEEEYKRFKKVGCDYIQGYYFSKPVDVKAVEKFFSNP